MPKTISRSVHGVILVGVVARTGLEECEIESSLAKDVVEDRVVGGASDEPKAKRVGAYDRAEWVRCPGVRLGRLFIRRPEQNSSAPGTSTFEVQESVDIWQQGTLSQCAGAVEVILFPVVEHDDNPPLGLIPGRSKVLEDLQAGDHTHTIVCGTEAG